MTVSAYILFYYDTFLLNLRTSHLLAEEEVHYLLITLIKNRDSYLF